MRLYPRGLKNIGRMIAGDQRMIERRRSMIYRIICLVMFYGDLPQVAFFRFFLGNGCCRSVFLAFLVRVS